MYTPIKCVSLYRFRKDAQRPVKIGVPTIAAVDIFESYRRTMRRITFHLSLNCDGRESTIGTRRASKSIKLHTTFCGRAREVGRDGGENLQNLRRALSLEGDGVFVSRSHAQSRTVTHNHARTKVKSKRFHARERGFFLPRNSSRHCGGFARKERDVIGGSVPKIEERGRGGRLFLEFSMALERISSVRVRRAQRRRCRNNKLKKRDKYGGWESTK